MFKCFIYVFFVLPVFICGSVLGADLYFDQRSEIWPGALETWAAPAWIRLGVSTNDGIVWIYEIEFSSAFYRKDGGSTGGVEHQERTREEGGVLVHDGWDAFYSVGSIENAMLHEGTFTGVVDGRFRSSMLRHWVLPPDDVLEHNFASDNVVINLSAGYITLLNQKVLSRYPDDLVATGDALLRYRLCRGIPDDDPNSAEPELYCSICGISIPPHTEYDCNLSGERVANESTRYRLGWRVALYRNNGDLFGVLDGGVLEPANVDGALIFNGSSYSNYDFFDLRDYGKIPECLVTKIERWLIPDGVSLAGVDLFDGDQFGPNVAGGYDYSDLGFPSESQVNGSPSFLESGDSVVYDGAEDFSGFQAYVDGFGTYDLMPYMAPDSSNMVVNSSGDMEHDVTSTLSGEYTGGDDSESRLDVGNISEGVRAGTLEGFSSVVSAIDGMEFDLQVPDIEIPDIEIPDIEIPPIEFEDITVDEGDPIPETDIADDFDTLENEKESVINDASDLFASTGGKVESVIGSEVLAMIPALQTIGDILKSAVKPVSGWEVIPAGMLHFKNGMMWPETAIVWDLTSGWFHKVKVLLRAFFALLWGVGGFLVMCEFFNKTIRIASL